MAVQLVEGLLQGVDHVEVVPEAEHQLERADVNTWQGHRQLHQPSLRHSKVLQFQEEGPVEGAVQAVA